MLRSHRKISTVQIQQSNLCLSTLNTCIQNTPRYTYRYIFQPHTERLFVHIFFWNILVWFLDHSFDCPMWDCLTASFQLVATGSSVFLTLWVLFYKCLRILADNMVDMMSSVPFQQRRATAQGAVGEAVQPAGRGERLFSSIQKLRACQEHCAKFWASHYKKRHWCTEVRPAGGYKDKEGSGAHCVWAATEIVREMDLLSLEKRSTTVAVYN